MSAVAKLPREHPFLNAEVITSFSSGVSETLQIMASIKGVFEKPYIEKDWKSKSDICVCLDLESGSFVGQIRFHFTRAALVHLYSKMLNEKVSPDSPEVMDCAGEFSNMCYGNAKTIPPLIPFEVLKSATNCDFETIAIKQKNNNGKVVFIQY